MLSLPTNPRNNRTLLCLMFCCERNLDRSWKITTIIWVLFQNTNKFYSSIFFFSFSFFISLPRESVSGYFSSLLFDIGIHVPIWHMGVAQRGNMLCIFINLCMTLTFDIYVGKRGIRGEFYSQFSSYLVFSCLLD